MAPAATTPVAEQQGPHPSYIQVAKPYLFEQRVTNQILGTGSNPQREDSARLEGVEWIDEVRRALQLPVRTYNTACIYYHKFRLVHKDSDYVHINAAAAALFSACKIEDTLKKSKEILCAAYNLRMSSPGSYVTPDDPVLENVSKSIIGLERLMLEASGFDYRSRHPQQYLFKLARQCKFDQDVTRTAYRMMLDLYRTFAPLKQTCGTMAFACLELTARLMDKQLDRLTGDESPQPTRWKTNRQQILETMLDLLDLYTHFQKSSLVGPAYNLDSFIKIRIELNGEADEKKIPRYGEWLEFKHNGAKLKTPKTPITPASPADMRVNGNDINSPATLSPKSAESTRRHTGVKGQDGTIRFMLDGSQAKQEKAAVAEYFNIEYEDYEVEVDEPAPVRPVPPDHHRPIPRLDQRNGRDFRDDRYNRHFPKRRR